MPACKWCMQAAGHPKGSIERMLLIAAFAVSGYSGSGRRTIKPFNPLLGETFEFMCQEQGMRLLIEKVGAISRYRVSPHLPLHHCERSMWCNWGKCSSGSVRLIIWQDIAALGS